MSLVYSEYTLAFIGVENRVSGREAGNIVMSEDATLYNNSRIERCS